MDGDGICPCPLRPLRYRGGRIAEGGCEHVMGLGARDEMFNSYPNCAGAEVLFFLKRENVIT